MIIIITAQKLRSTHATFAKAKGNETCTVLMLTTTVIYHSEPHNKQPLFPTKEYGIFETSLNQGICLSHLKNNLVKNKQTNKQIMMSVHCRDQIQSERLIKMKTKKRSKIWVSTS